MRGEVMYSSEDIVCHLETKASLTDELAEVLTSPAAALNCTEILLYVFLSLPSSLNFPSKM